MVAGYRVDGLLGEGGMGAVYRATQLSLNRTIALKILSAEFGDDPGFRERFRREGQLQAALDHPHIVTVYEAGETEHGLFLAMRLVRGPTVKDMILSKELDTDRSLEILAPVADALDSAHGVGLIHRDVKPQNILVGARDHAYLADFGLTKATGEGGLTETGQFIGTIDYVAPEQVQGEQATGQSDVYALAGVLYECLAGEVPFARPTEAAVLFAHISEPPPKLTEKRPELPAAIDDVLAKGMAKLPADRYATPTELMEAAASALGKSVGPVARAEPAPAAGQAPGGPTALSPTPGGQTAAASTRLAGAGAPTAPAGAVAAPAPAARRGAPFALVAAGAAAVLAVAGFVAGSSGSDEESVDFASSASSGSLGLSFPSSWERRSDAPRTPGLDFSDPIVLAPASSPDARLEAGLVASAAGPALLPESFRKLLPEEPPPGDPVKLGDYEGYRYAGLDPKGAGDPITIYTAPTAKGAATIACTARGQTAEKLLGECEAVATTLELSGVKALPLGPSEAYAKSLSTALGKLGSARKSGEAALRSAGTQDAQGAAAARLASAYTAAASSLDRAQVSPADREANDRIVAALRAIGGAYGRAATAARAGEGGAYGAATADVRSGGRRLERALKGLKALGYSTS
jgi:hypothetical protein